MGDATLTVAAGRTVLDVLVAGADAHPDRDLLVYDDLDAGVTRLSWRQVLAQALAVAGRLHAEGVRAGDRVHVQLSNRPEFLFTWFGCAALGAAIVPTNTRASADELAHALGHSEARLSVVEAASRATVEAAAACLGRRLPVLDCTRESLAGEPIDPLSAGGGPRPGDDLGILYTSGTTSLPKGVRVTHANYVYAGEVVARNLRLGPDDRVLTVLPLFHANAQYYTTMGALVARATMILSSRFSARRAVGQAVAHGATILSLFAAPIRMILAQRPDPVWRDHRLRAVLFAQNLTDAELAAWDAVVGAPLLQIYGMTETIGPPLMNPLDDPRPHTVGRVSLGYHCRVVREDGRPARVGEVGELHVHGTPGVSLMRGYLHDPVATTAALRDGWLMTGDSVRVERDGYLAFVDRRKDMIKRAGENVAASEVERVLRDHPAVRDVAVFGVPDPVRDEQIVAAVVLSDARAHERDLIAWCAERMAPFRVPSRVMAVPALPRTAVGKVQKHLLRDRWLSGRGALADR